MHGYGRKFIGAGDEIILTTLEHHSNIVPWQMLAEERGARIRVVPINDDGELLIDGYEKLFNEHTRFVGVSHVSNALGSINTVKQMINSAPTQFSSLKSNIDRYRAEQIHALAGAVHTTGVA